MTHRYPPDPAMGDHPDALMFDNCEDCESRTEFPELLLWDNVRLSAMWSLMVQNEHFEDGGVYRSGVEARLAHALYGVAVMLERFGYSPFRAGFLYGPR